MPRGMCLKSEGFASNLYDPHAEFTLANYCREQGIEYAHLGVPVRLDTFTSYGLEFQKRFVPDLEDKLVTSVQQCGSGFGLQLSDETSVVAKNVVVAAGITHFAYLPPMLSDFPEELVTHSSKHTHLGHFTGRDVTVIGSGASAVDLAALLYDAGACVRIIARRAAIRFNSPPPDEHRSLLARVRSPLTGLGPGWRSYFCTSAPYLFRHLPTHVRTEIVRRHLGPAPGWFVKEKIVGRVPTIVGCKIRAAQVENGRMRLDVTDGDGSQRTVVTDHVIAGTGYKVDLARLEFISPEFRARIKSIDESPELSSNFESSVPGLYFVGAAAANSFGPLLRFAFGARFAAERVSNHFARALRAKGPSHNGSHSKRTISDETLRSSKAVIQP